MNVAVPSYNPKSRILFITIDSHNKKKAGVAEYNDATAITSLLSGENQKFLVRTREEIRNSLLSGKVEFDGLPLSQHEFNLNLVHGKEFGGTDRNARYLPSFERYQGRFFLAMGDEGVKKLLQSGHHLLFLSGLFGLSMPFEPVQLYSCPVVRDSNIQKLWRSNNGLTHVLEEYIQKYRIQQIFDFTARYEWRDEVDWDAVIEHTGVKILHCVSSMGNEEDALIPFGMLLRNRLLSMTDNELLQIKHDTIIEGISFRSIPKRKVGDPDLTLEEWGRTIPFPLSSILWLYLAHQKNDEKALSHLLQFFEALSIFHATVLLSGFSTNKEIMEAIKLEYPREMHSLDPNNLMTFGSWLHINKVLIKKGKTMLSGTKEQKQQIKDVFRTKNLQVLKMLFSEDIPKILFRAVKIRDQKAHEGHQNEDMIREKLTVLRELLTELKYSMSVYWEDYLLVLPGEITFRDGTFTHKAKLLIQTSYPFREMDIDLKEPMETDNIYLFDQNESRALKLLPFVKLFPYPQLACYYYNKMEGQEVCLVSYHYESNPKITVKSNETIQSLNRLSL